MLQRGKWIFPTPNSSVGMAFIPPWVEGHRDPDHLTVHYFLFISDFLHRALCTQECLVMTKICIWRLDRLQAIPVGLPSPYVPSIRLHKTRKILAQQLVCTETNLHQ